MGWNHKTLTAWCCVLFTDFVLKCDCSSPDKFFVTGRFQVEFVQNKCTIALLCDLALTCSRWTHDLIENKEKKGYFRHFRNSVPADNVYHKSSDAEFNTLRGNLLNGNLCTYQWFAPGWGAGQPTGNLTFLGVLASEYSHLSSLLICC